MEKCTRPHALVLPLPAQGHINPMLNFSAHLASRGVLVTFVNTQKAHERIQQSHGHHHQEQIHELGIRFAVIPGEYQPSPPPGSDTINPSEMMSLLEGMASQQGLLERMVVESRITSDPITCIVSDAFFNWTQPLATKLRIQRFLFWTSVGMSFASVLEMRSRKGNFIFSDTSTNGDVGGGDPNRVIETGGVQVNLLAFKASLPMIDKPEIAKHFFERLNGIENTTCVIVNTFEALEAPSLKVSSTCEAPVRYVGPIMPPDLVSNGALSASFYEEERSCLHWLDKQEKGTVLYISFGSAASLTPQQLEEFAAGIEESKQPFVWVARDSIGLFSKEFLERTRGYGIVVKWAPQIQVLAHPAVGGFMTHCGWNSVIESIHMGVPMLCFPCFADQFINSMLLTTVWNLGIAMDKRDGIITRHHLCKAITDLMHSTHIRQRAAAMKTASCQALEQDGSSSKAMESIISYMMAVVS